MCLTKIKILNSAQPLHHSIASALILDNHFGSIIRNITSNPKYGKNGSPNPYSWDGNLLRISSGELCVPINLVKEILLQAHDSPTSGHFGFLKTMHRLKSFYWPRKPRVVQAYLNGCESCQRNKSGNRKPQTSPECLEFPSRRWRSVAMDIFVQLPKTKAGFDAITTFVDRFSKRPHFLPFNTTDYAVIVAKNFHDTIFKLHGIPDSIVSDRDHKFMSLFWK